jgi:hypothetical protein
MTITVIALELILGATVVLPSWFVEFTSLRRVPAAVLPIYSLSSWYELRSGGLLYTLHLFIYLSSYISFSLCVDVRT